jgi:hypothetical protein
MGIGILGRCTRHTLEKIHGQFAKRSNIYRLYRHTYVGMYRLDNLYRLYRLYQTV